MLDIHGLSFAYGASAPPVLEDVDLHVGAGEFVCLIGPSGCGKSTLLRVIMGLQQARSGEVALEAAANDIGFLFQGDTLLPWRSARDNVALGLRTLGQSRRAARREAEHWLGSVGLAGLGDRYPRELSGGQRKRVSIAQVLARKPRLLLMDEPFASLDAIVRRYITEDLLRWVAGEQLTVLMVTHDLEEAAAISDRIVLLGSGPQAQVKQAFDVPLARPRDLQRVRQQPAYARLVQRLWQAMAQEIDIPGRTPAHPADAARSLRLAA